MKCTSCRHPANSALGYLEIHHIDNFAAGVASRDFYFVSKDRKVRSNVHSHKKVCFNFRFFNRSVSL